MRRICARTTTATTKRTETHAKLHCGDLSASHESYGLPAACLAMLDAVDDATRGCATRYDTTLAVCVRARARVCSPALSLRSCALYCCCLSGCARVCVRARCKSDNNCFALFATTTTTTATTTAAAAQRQ